MEEQPRGHETARQLMQKGVDIPNPLSIDIGPEVDPASYKNLPRVVAKNLLCLPESSLVIAFLTLRSGFTYNTTG